MNHHPQPAMRHSEQDLIPRVLIRGMFALILACVALVGFAVLTDRPTVGQPKPAEIVAEREIILIGGGAKAVSIRAPDGSISLDLDHGGFITVIQNGLQRERLTRGIAQDLPVRLVEYANGRLTLVDSHSGWSAELGAFGDDNKAAFERLMSR